MTRRAALLKLLVTNKFMTKKKKTYQRGEIFGEAIHRICVSFKLDEGYVRAYLIANFPELKEHSRCANCDASMESFWHDLSPGLVSVLIKAVMFVRKNNKNSFHLSKDLNLTKVEYNNAQKLRFHGLITKVKDQNGYWLITNRGGSFLRDEMAVPKSVQTFRNKVIGHSDELVSIRDYDKKFPTFQSDFMRNLEQGRLL